MAAAGRGKAAGKFLPIALAPPACQAPQPGLEIVLPNGLRVYLPPQFDADALRALLAVLGVPPC